MTEKANPRDRYLIVISTVAFLDKVFLVQYFSVRFQF